MIAQGVSQLRKRLPEIIEDGENELSTMARTLFSELLEEIKELDKKIKSYDVRIGEIAKGNETCKRLLEIEGVGTLTATAMVATIGDARVFKNGREMSASLGLVPRQYSSGGKSRMLGISKRGDKYMRYLLVHGARSAIISSKQMPEKKSIWVKQLIEKRGKNKAIVALANKQVRIMWAIMAKGEHYQRVA